MAKKAIILFGILLLCENVWAPHVEAQTLLKMGYSGSAGFATDLLKINEREGIWKKHGIDLRAIYLTSGTLMAQTLSAGEIGLAGFDVTAMLNLGVSGVTDLKVIAVLIDRLEYILVTRKDVKSGADLKNKRLAISRYGSVSDIVTRIAVQYFKLDASRDVSILQSGNSSTRIAALAAGHVDGAVVSPQQVNRILATGCCHVLADLQELPIDYANYGVVVSGSLLKNQRQDVRRFLQALTEGIYVFKRRPETAMAVLAQSLGSDDPKSLRPAYERLAKALHEYPVPEPKAIQSVLDSLNTPKARNAKAADFIDASLMEEIKQSGFINRLSGK
jgi:ABC-type nitrate/sulfonate/bicarbonate transport system substrate-binding protein